MKYLEELSWILDKPGTTIQNQEEKFWENVAFVHSLGKKCDRVGWSTVKPDDPKADEILEQIAAYCKQYGWYARGLYNREYAEFDTDWYEIQGTPFQDETMGTVFDIPAQDGRSFRTCTIQAYRELTAEPKKWGHSLYLPERFCKAYESLGLTDLDFFWVKDTGKYQAEPYFHALGTQRIPRVAVAWELKNRDLRNLGPDGGWLPRLGEVFHRWTQLNLPYCYLKEDMPAKGVVYAYIPRTVNCCGLYQVLVHKDVARQLLQKKAIPTGALKPVPVLDHLLAGYTLRETTECPRPATDYIAQSRLDWEKLQKKNRPQWQVTEKQALKLLRKTKAERKENFGKKLPKVQQDALAQTNYTPMLPYYLVANGGELSDEYRLLSLKEALAETAIFHGMLNREELLDNKPEGIVICTCANGDWVLLLSDGMVTRFSHEAPEATTQWPSFPQFLVDALNT